MNIAFILDPLSQLNPGHDTTVALMESAQKRGHEVWVTQACQLAVRDGQAWALVAPVTLTPARIENDHWVTVDPWYDQGPAQWRSLADFQAVWMRTDPPVTIPYLYATYILDLLDPAKTLVLNSPQGLRTANEKIYALQFPEVIPPTIVSQDKGVIREFVEAQGAAVFKPIGGKAGEGILFVSAADRNFNSLVEISTKQGQEPIIIQGFLPEAKNGDKRIIMLDGEPIGAVNRIPTGSDFRGNMAVGGAIAKVDITPRDRKICQLVGPRLRADGLYFVGLDVIGGYLTEVNVTSPTCVREIDLFNQDDLGDRVTQWLEARIAGQ